MRPQNPSSKFTAILIPWVDDDCSLQRLPFSVGWAVLCTPFLNSARTGVRALPQGYAFTLGALLANVKANCPRREDRYIPASTAKRLSLRTLLVTSAALSSS